MALKHAIEEVKETAHEVGKKVSQWMPWNWGKTRLPVRSDGPPQRSPSTSELMTLRDELDDLHRRVFGSLSAPDRFPFFDGAGPMADFLDTPWPSIDLNEDDRAYHVSAELPGVDESDLDVSIDERSVTIRGEKKDYRRSNRRGVRRIESYHGSFHRTVALPAAIDPDAAKANYRRGRLEIELPKADPAATSRRRITVE